MMFKKKKEQPKSDGAATTKPVEAAPKATATPACGYRYGDLIYPTLEAATRQYRQDLFRKFFYEAKGHSLYYGGGLHFPSIEARWDEIQSIMNATLEVE